MMCLPILLLICPFFFFHLFCSRQSPPFVFLISSFSLLHTISPDPFCVHGIQYFLLFLREWPAQARDLGVDTFSLLTWAIRTCVSDMENGCKWRFPFIDRNVDAPYCEL